MRSIFFTLTLLFATVAVAGQASNQAPAWAELEGTWILNRDKSDTGFRFNPGTWRWIIKVENNTVTISQDYPERSAYEDCEVVLHADDSGETNPNCFGRRIPGTAESKTLWKKGKLVREYEWFVSAKSRIKQNIKETFSISKSGNFIFEQRQKGGARVFTAADGSGRASNPTDDVILTFVFDREK